MIYFYNNLIRLSVEKLNLEVTKLSTNLNNLSKQLGKCSDDNLKERFQGFFEVQI